MWYKRSRNWRKIRGINNDGKYSFFWYITKLIISFSCLHHVNSITIRKFTLVVPYSIDVDVTFSNYDIFWDMLYLSVVNRSLVFNSKYNDVSIKIHIYNCVEIHDSCNNVIIKAILGQAIYITIQSGDYAVTVILFIILMINIFIAT